MGDSDLTELMGDAAAQDKNPDVYEAAFTEWARRQPDREEPGPDIDDRVGPPEDLDSVQLDLVRAELDTATADLKARIDSGGPGVDAAIARVEVAEGLLRHEQKMAAARAGANDGARPETATSTAGDAPAVEATPERAQAWNTVRDTETKAEQDGTGFEEALGRSPEETAAAIAERDAVRDGYTSAADKARDEQDVSADPAPAGPPASEESADKKASTGLPAMSDNDIIRKAESLAAQKRFGQDVQQEIAALKSEAARRNPGLDMAVGGILAIDVRQAREQGVRSSRQRTRWRRR